MSCITEILKLKGNQDAFVPPGGWIAVEGGGIYKDYEYLIVLNSLGHRCGYVALLPSHPFCAANDYDTSKIDCHGGITFMSREHDLKNLLDIACNDVWVGFDCGHYCDKCDVESFIKYFGNDAHQGKEYFFHCMDNPYSSIKTFKYAEKECRNIIDQLLKAAA